MWRDRLIGECEDGFGFIMKVVSMKWDISRLPHPKSSRISAALEKWEVKLDELSFLRLIISKKADGSPSCSTLFEQVEPAGRVEHIEYLRAVQQHQKYTSILTVG